MLVETSQSWFAVQVAPRCEKKVSILLDYKGYQLFLPTYKTASNGNNPLKKLERPLFPGYIFCRIAADVCGIIVTTPGVVRIVGFGKKPSPIHNSEIEMLQRVVGSGAEVRPFPYLKPGQKVQIKEGPLAGICGTLTQIKNQMRVVVSVDAIMRSIAVDVGIESVAPIEDSGSRTSSLQNSNSDVEKFVQGSCNLPDYKTYRKSMKLNQAYISS